MKFYAKMVMTNVHNEPFQDQGPSGKMVPLTLGLAAANVLMGRIPADQSAPANLKIHRYNLAKKILGFVGSKELGAMDVAAEDIAMIKGRVLEAYDTPVAGRWHELVEGGPPSLALEA